MGFEPMALPLTMRPHSKRQLSTTQPPFPSHPLGPPLGEGSELQGKGKKDRHLEVEPQRKKKALGDRRRQILKGLFHPKVMFTTPVPKSIKTKALAYASAIGETLK